MTIPFFKYHGTGNDFILIDNRKLWFDQNNTDLVKHMCNRRFGIGADGLMLLQLHEEYDFEMIYYNADGRPSTLCGNGSRCVTAFAKKLGVIHERAEFLAVDGPHQAMVLQDGSVTLTMNDVEELEGADDTWVINTGSPHYCQEVTGIDTMNVFAEGSSIRNSKRFQREGINVNFIERGHQHEIKVRTYERGVEDETYSCGTGVVAASIAAYMNQADQNGYGHYVVDTKGGRLSVTFDVDPETNLVSNVCLTGPVAFVYRGQINWPESEETSRHSLLFLSEE